jgi:hypothetical protein
MSLFEVCQWLQHTTIGTSIRESEYMFPVIEGTHLLALSAFVGSALMYDLRLIGVLWRNDPVSKVKAQFMPIIMVGFAIMVITGSLLFWSEPVSAYQSVFFRAKVTLLILAGLNAVIFHLTIDREAAEWGLNPIPPLRARVAGYVSIVLWIAIIAAGRFTAYNL